MGKIRTHLRYNPRLDTLVVHVGSNDVFDMPKKELCDEVKTLLKTLRGMLPGCQLVWSHILLRLFWYGEEKGKAGDKVRNEGNRKAYSMCKNLDGDNRITFHPALIGRDH